MGWGTTANPEIYYNREIFKNKCEVEALIDENKELIQSIQNRIRLLMGSTNYKDLLGLKEGESVIDALEIELTDAFQSLDEYISENCKYSLLLEGWDSKRDDYTLPDINYVDRVIYKGLYNKQYRKVDDPYESFAEKRVFKDLPEDQQKLNYDKDYHRVFTKEQKISLLKQELADLENETDTTKC